VRLSNWISKDDNNNNCYYYNVVVVPHPGDERRISCIVVLHVVVVVVVMVVVEKHLSTQQIQGVERPIKSLLYITSMSVVTVHTLDGQIACCLNLSLIRCKRLIYKDKL